MLLVFCNMGIPQGGCIGNIINFVRNLVNLHFFSFIRFSLITFPFPYPCHFPFPFLQKPIDTLGGAVTNLYRHAVSPKSCPSLLFFFNVNLFFSFSQTLTINIPLLPIPLIFLPYPNLSFTFFSSLILSTNLSHCFSFWALIGFVGGNIRRW